MLEETNAAYAALRADPQALSEEVEVQDHDQVQDEATPSVLRNATHR